MLLLILAHIDTGHHVLVVKQILGKSLGKLGLTHTGGAEEDKRADRTARVVKACTAAAHGIGNGSDGLFLAYHAAVELGFKVKQFLTLAGNHFFDGDTGPARNHIGDVLGIDLLLDKGFLALHHLELFLNVCILLLLGWHLGVAYLGHLG